VPDRQLKTAIHHLENEKGTGAKMCSAIASGIITAPFLDTVSQVFAKVYSVKFPSHTMAENI